MRRFLILLLIALIFAGAMPGKTNVASRGKKLVLIGTVYDTNHAVIASGEVVAQNFEGNEFSALTNGEGLYKLELPFGTYKLEANASGFCPKRVDVLRVRSSLKETLDFILEIKDGARPCAQKTMIKRDQPVRKPELFRSIAE